MKLDRKLKMGMVGGGPGAFIGEVHRKANRMDAHIKPDKDYKILFPRPRVRKKRDIENEIVWEKSRICLSSDRLLLAAVTMIILSMGAALIIYFSNPKSAHQEELQKILVVALIMAFTLGIGTVFSRLGGK